MPAKNTTTRTNRRKVAPIFEEVCGYIRRFVAMDEAKLRLSALWAIGTWTFSPSSPASPFTYPYWYITGARGSGKTTLGLTMFGDLCRNFEKLGDVTGPALFRMLGDYDEESGSVIPHYPTIGLDEIDATFNGPKVENLRGPLNLGYQRGATIPRAFGKVSVSFPVYCPKVLIGIDNGHLPDTVTHRSIRIEMRQATDEQVAQLAEWYPWDTETESAELKERMSAWVNDHAMVLRDYNPQRPEKLKNREWQIARSLVQLAHALGNEKQITADLVEVLTTTAKPERKVRLYQAIYDLFEETGEQSVTTRQIFRKLVSEDIVIPGMDGPRPGKALRNLLGEDGAAPTSLRLRDGHPGRDTASPTGTARGYMLHTFADAFEKYLDLDAADDFDDV